MAKKEKPSFVIKVFEDSDPCAESYVGHVVAPNTFIVHVPTRKCRNTAPLALTESGIKEISRESILATWCHEFGHVLAFIFGLTYNSLDKRTIHPPNSPELKLLTAIFGEHPIGSCEIKAEMEAWNLAELIAGFDRTKSLALGTYQFGEVLRARKEFHKLFEPSFANKLLAALSPVFEKSKKEVLILTENALQRGYFANEQSEQATKLNTLLEYERLRYRRNVLEDDATQFAKRYEALADRLKNKPETVCADLDWIEDETRRLKELAFDLKATFDEIIRVCGVLKSLGLQRKEKET